MKALFEEEDGIIRDYTDALVSQGMPFAPLVGVSRYVSRVEPVPHRHAGCLELLLCTDGNCSYTIDGRDYTLRPGDVLAIPPDVEHSILEYPKGLCTYSMLLNTGRRFTGLSTAEADWMKRRLLALPRLFNSGGCRLKDLFNRILQLSREEKPDIGAKLALRMAVFDLLLALPGAASRPNPRHINRRLQDLADLMKRRPEADYPLARLSEQYGLSVNGLIAQFREETGQTPHAYLLRCRVERARELLVEHSVAATAHRLGFPSPQHFATQFKRLTGFSPSSGKNASRKAMH